MASKRKLQNMNKYNDYGPFDPMPMSEPLFTQPPDNNLDNRRDQDVNNLHLPDSQPLNDSQDYTCCDDNELESNNRRDQDVNNLHLPDSQSLNDSQDYTCCDDNELESISDNRRDQDVIMNDVDTNNLPDSQPLYDSQDYTCCDDNEPEPEKEETEDNLKKTQDTKSETENKVQNMEQNETSCVHCIFDKELDKRNYYFGNLLIGELQFLPPCMRSEAYITILKYIDSLKKQHRDKHNEYNIN